MRFALTPWMGQRRKDFAFVNYVDRDSALKAIEGRHGFEVQGTLLFLHSAGLRFALAESVHAEPPLFFLACAQDGHWR